MLERQGITGATVDRSAVKSEVEIWRRLKTDQLSVNKRLGIEELAILPDEAGWVKYTLMARQLAEKEFLPHRTQPVEKVGQFQRRDAVNVKHPDRRRIVAKVQGSTVTGCPREALLAKCDLPIVEIQPKVGVKKLKVMNRWRRRPWRFRVERKDVGHR